MYNYKLTISYDGTRYNGWQRQGNTENTIQGKLNEIIGKYLEEDVDLAGSGRTDKGVHAKGQVASFKCSKLLEMENFLQNINSYLPLDIRILDVSRVPERFHARLSAVSKTYEYVIDNGKAADVFSRKYAWRVEEELDTGCMKQAAKLLMGTHDYKSFCGNKHFKKSSIRTVTDISIKEEEGKIILEFKGDGFLQNMVRILTGTIVEAGAGLREADTMPDILDGKNRELAGRMAPPEGLFLKKVEY